MFIVTARFISFQKLMDHAEVQNNELDALEAIFGEGFRRIENKSAWNVSAGSEH